MKKLSRAIRPDAQAFDEARIFTVPRFKTSGMSGDEWRISAHTQLLRKGKVIVETHHRNIETAIDFLKADYLRAIDDAKAYFAGEGDYCDQEGCSATATVTYRVRKEFSRDRPHEWNREIPPEEAEYRRFCTKHSKRGDAAFDDSDTNYELISGEVASPDENDIKPAVFGGIIKLDSE